MYGRNGSKYTWPLHLRSRFNKTTIYPLETAGLGKMSDMFLASAGMLQMLPLILENSAFSCIIAILLNNNLFEIRTFSIFLKCLNCYRI